jgi:hypothetical protein
MIDDSYMYERYSPHVTKIPGVKLPEKFALDCLSLGRISVVADPDKSVVTVMPLGQRRRRTASMDSVGG